MSEPATLQRALGTFTLTLYGVGVIVGAGIFVLVGEVISHAGNAGWLAFVGASLAALPTGLSYAELASRYPKSGGEAVFVERAFGRSDVSFLVGFFIVASGVMSTAAVSHGFADYLRVVLPMPSVPRWLLIVGFLGVLTIINDRGIRGSTWLNAVFTTVSVLALVVLGLAGTPQWDEGIGPLVQAPLDVPPLAILSAVALAFYAFIGFEDICNVAEETREPSRTIPRAILWSVTISTVIYALVTITALVAVPAAELASHPAPMALVSERVLPGISSRWLAAVAVLAVTNTALFNLIMTSRVLYGMSRSGWIPAALGKVDNRTRTPRLGVGLAFVLAAVFALTGVLGVLAEATNVVILLAFAAVNVSLIVIRLRGIPPDSDAGPTFRVPIALPFVGVASTLVLLTELSGGAYLRAAGLVAVGVVLHLIVRRGRASASVPETH